ncbi:MAG TPA: polyphosphate kinase 1 [Candidatus Methylacidiphilales bacterium]|jgi:polyphosphate kinase|nr:polyphosphate kinase 1 [Candidatus Methylacidiphilales bacterium]
MSQNSAPQRLVALGADGADILHELGVWPQVVGVTAFYKQLPGAEEKPRVSGFSSGNMEAILRLEPDLVITSTDVQHRLASDLIKAGVTVWAVNSRSLDDIYGAIRNLGQIVRRGERAEELVAQLERALQPVEVNGAPRPKVYFEEWPEPLITGIGWVSELIERAGGSDIFAELRREKKAAGRAVAPEEVSSRAPEIIFASWCGRPVQVEDIASRRGWETIPAVRDGRLVEIASDDILQAGPGLVRGYEILKREIGRLRKPPRQSQARHNSRVARPPPKEVSSSSRMTTPNLSDPKLFINRELSWLAFNRRVLEEAQDPSQPLLERVRFLGIVTSNLDEFFEVRVAGIKQQIEHESDDAGPDGMSARQTFDAIRQDVLKLIGDQYQLWNNELLPALGEHGVYLHDFKSLGKQDKTWATHYFREEVFPVLTPLAVDASHPFPQLQNKSHNLFLRLKRPERPTEALHAVVAIPRVLPRLVRIPHPKTDEWHYILIQNLIQNHIHDLFPGLEVDQVYGFRITRNSDLYIDEEEAENLLRTIEDELRKRARGNAVRLEIEHGCPKDMQSVLLDIFKLGEDDVYLVNGPLNFLHLMPLASIDALASLRDKPYVPITSHALPAGCDYFQIIRRKDVLLHHPYQSFSSVVEFLEHAASDPAVLAIKMTLYRTSGDSPIVHSLIHAAEQGKQVTVLVELRARFDEANNILWARQLEEAGVHVVYGLVGLKTHCKVLMIVRRDDDRLRHYLHLGTGNYHSTTARFYTDLSLFTSNEELGEEVGMLFNTMTGLSEFKGVKQLLVAPFQMHDKFLKLIRHERDLAREGKGGRIIVKLNSLVEESLIVALYEASQAGVKIDLIVRGICCLRPGVPGVSENIRVVSIVGRFLEHSRIFYFGNDGAPKVYLGSADWMPRNLFRRVEVVFPVLDPGLRKRVTDVIIPGYLSDCVKARVLGPDGVYTRAVCPPGKEPTQAQLHFRNLARKSASLRVESKTEKLPDVTRKAP